MVKPNPGNALNFFSAMTNRSVSKVDRAARIISAGSPYSLRSDVLRDGHQVAILGQNDFQGGVECLNLPMHRFALRRFESNFKRRGTQPRRRTQHTIVAFKDDPTARAESVDLTAAIAREELFRLAQGRFQQVLGQDCTV